MEKITYENNGTESVVVAYDLLGVSIGKTLREGQDTEILEPEIIEIPDTDEEEIQDPFSPTLPRRRKDETTILPIPKA